MEIINGFLGQQEFAKLQTLVMASDKTEGFQHILWGYNDVIVDNNDIDKFQFVHIFYSDDVPRCFKIVGKVTILFATLSIFVPSSNSVYPLLEFI